MRIVLPIFFLWNFLLLSLSLNAQHFDNGFHFYMPPGDSSAQRFLPEFAKQPITNFVGIDANGHFQAGGQRLRFWGTNLVEGACFPKKTKAPWIAARLRKLGFNLVRFTDMDNYWAGQNATIFPQDVGTTQVLDFFQLDKFHYFVHHLKQQGIYSCINLHSVRQFQEGDGVLGVDSIQDNGNAITIFDRQLIALQKGYAQQLLTPVSLYTGLSLANDPAVAMVEITNENSLYSYWRGDRLQHFTHGEGQLMQRHCDTLDLRWNQFLQSKYGSQAALNAAWNALSSTPGANQQLLDNNFENNNPAGDWKLELHDAAAATLDIVQTNPYEGQDCARVSVTNVTGTGWHIQFKQENLSVEAGRAYTVHFAARADQPASIWAYTMRNLDPWTWYGSKYIDLTTQWQEFSYTFVAPEDNADFVRFAFSFENNLGNFYFDKITLADAGATGVAAGESLANGTVRRFNYSDRGGYTGPRIADMTEFYLKLQRDYFNEMKNYIKNDLGVKASVSGSNSLGGISDVYTHQDMDYIDDHSLWDYPAWSYNGSEWVWEVMNTSMVKSDWFTTPNKLFSGLAMKGKPFMIGQYYQAYPNIYQAEMMPWMSAYGAFHDADAILFYSYNHDYDEWERDMIDDNYATHRNPTQMALAPMYGFAFRNGLMASVSNPIGLNYPESYIFQQVPIQDNSGRWGTYIPYNTRLALTTTIRTSGFTGTDGPDFSLLPDGPGIQATTGSGQTTIDGQAGILTTTTPKFVSVTGFVHENGPHEAGPLNLLSANDFAVVSLLSLTNEPVNTATESVLTVSSRAQNTNMVWNGNSIQNAWGQQPTEVQPIALSLELAHANNQMRIYPLTPTGAEGSYSVVAAQNGKFNFTVDQAADQTLWYGLEFSNVSATIEAKAEHTVSISPNPASERSFVQVSMKAASPLAIRLLDVNGRFVKTIYQNENPVLTVRERIEVGGLAKGVYFVECRGGDWLRMEKLIVP
ncbi:MAG: carbohydrate binding domain-containing protein [Saprospiraceae bacterium]|nr:carbohydrate binding domain-containing protein [Saprospiraceae bacterium]